jgi:curved DNA-binding protein CbpA
VSSRDDLPRINLYARLGVAPEASTAEINRAYRALAHALHPDSAQTRGGDPDELRLVIEAHHVLSDPRRRQRYDAGRSPRPSNPPPSQTTQRTVCAVCNGAGTIAQPCPSVRGYRTRPDELTVAPNARGLLGLPRPRATTYILRRVRRYRAQGHHPAEPGDPLRRVSPTRVPESRVPEIGRETAPFSAPFG